MKEKTITYALALIIGLSVAMFSYYATLFPFKMDSDSYIEQARNFMARGVFESTPWSLTRLDAVSIPDKDFPPGYPLLIVIAGLLLSEPAEIVAPALSLVALLFLPICIVFAFNRSIGFRSAFLTATLVVLTPTAVNYGYMAYSDLLSLLLVIFSVNRLLLAGNKATSRFYLGLITGFSYLLRNANLSLLISISLYFFWLGVTEPEKRKEKLNAALIWLAGNAVFIVPWFIYNLLTFGKLHPYSMPPGKLGLGENIYDYIKAQLDVLLACSELDQWLAGSFAGSFAGIILLSVVAVVLLHQVMTTFRQWSELEQKTFVISVAYSVIGAAMTIAARTRYQWGVHIEDRYTLPYSCFILVALVIIAKNATLNLKNRYWVPSLIVSLFLLRMDGLQKLYQFDRYSPYSQSVASAAEQIKKNNDVICDHLNERLALSSLAFVYRIVCGAPARQIYLPFANNKFLETSLKKWADIGANKGIVVSLFPDFTQDDLDLPLKQDDLIKLNSSGWQVERNEKENLIISHQSLSSH